MQDIRSPLCFWSLLTIFIVKPLHSAKLRFGKISRHILYQFNSIYIIWWAQSLRQSSKRQTQFHFSCLPFPAEERRFCFFLIPKITGFPSLPPLKKILMLEFSVLWILNTNGKLKAYRTIMQNTNETQTVDIAIRRLRKVAPDGMQRAQMLLKVWRIWSLLHDSNQVKISDQLFSVSWYHKSKPKGLNQLLKIMWTWQL